MAALAPAPPEKRKRCAVLWQI